MAEVTCPTCEWRFEAPEADEWRQRKCPSCGEVLLVWHTEARYPPGNAPPPPMSHPEDHRLTFIEHTIPTANPAALWSYYLGLFAVIPCLGIGLAVAALVMGQRGLEFAKQHPEKLGKGHAVVGMFFAIFWMALWVAVVAAMSMGAAPSSGP